MFRIAKIVVDISVDREFDYLVPDELVESCRLGCRVGVPFGRTKQTGYVIGLGESDSSAKLKYIESVETGIFFNDSVLELAKWMAGYYCSQRSAVLRTMLPGIIRRGRSAFQTRLVVSGVDGTDGQRVTDKQSLILDILSKEKSLLLSRLINRAGTTISPVKTLEKRGLVKIERENFRRNPFLNRNILPTEPRDLTDEQELALSKICETMDSLPGSSSEQVTRHTVLLYGVTGSGKTEVYMQAMDQVLRKGKGAIMLVPEISLTPQTVERFFSRFGDKIAVLHSHLSDGERHDEWHRIQAGEARIVIGARSAVFAPVRELGLIVVDEEHETSYKQAESPMYNGRDVAVMRGKLEGCAVVLGSATPSMESWNNARSGKYSLVRLNKRVDNRRMPMMRIVDMRIEAERVGRPNVFSRELLDAIHARLKKGEQVILFLNRRGFSSSIICPKCGYIAECNQCSVSYTYHRSDDTLKCHVCGRQINVPGKCPGCSDPVFKFAGIGTQRVESIVKKCFPHARIERLDTDVTGKKDAYDRILGEFKSGRINILLGTQMIAKGLHFPNVTLVGVIYADLSLHVADFRAGERTFQLLAQVAGRAGRGDVVGEVIVQTYTPHHVAVQSARRLDYDSFSDQELEFRKELFYPPFSHLVCITAKGPVEEQVKYHMASLARRVKELSSSRVMMSEPVPAPLAKAKGKYRYQLMLRAGSTSLMTRPVSKALAGFRWPRGTSCSVDVDAVGLM